MRRTDLPNHIIWALVCLLITGCKAPTSGKSDNSDNNWGDGEFSMYVSLGNSLTAGVADGALYAAAQANSFPSLIAKMAGIQDNFEQPLMSGNGFSFNDTLGRLSVSVLDLKISFLEPGTESNRGLSRPFNNLGTPLITASQMLTATNSVEADSNHFVDKILRGSGRTLVEEALSLDPTIITLWVGNNDLLEAASLGLASAESPYTPLEDFRDDLNGILYELTSETAAPIFIGNVLDFTTLPYFTSLPSFIIDPTTGNKKYLYGEGEEGIRLLTDEDLILYWALPDYFLLAESGDVTIENALVDTVILDASEKAEIVGLIQQYNDRIQTVANSYSQVYMIDIHGMFKDISNNGFLFGDAVYTPDLIAFTDNGEIQLKVISTMFSFDGLHPNKIGYAAITNAFIEKINTILNASLPLVEISDL
ncbi:MAG: SGNH/GDSL hydrolase family protein [Candidatus Neomarinimicrobiota bacterium]